MKINDFCKKFKQHLISGGLFYAFWRAVKYFIFIMRKPEDVWQDYSVESGPLRIVASLCGVQVYWLDKPLTTKVGLNVSVNTLGLWTDSSKATWQLMEKNKDLLKLRISFFEIPLVQVWNIKINDKTGFVWEIESQNTEWIHINEIRIVNLLNPQYTSWFCGYQHGNFCRFEKHWRDFDLSQPESLLVGVRFSTEGANLPALSLEVMDKASRVLIQNTSFRDSARIIGFSTVYQNEKCNLPAGSSQAFKVVTQIFEKTSILDSKIECLRQETLEASFRKDDSSSAPKRLKILLVNLPWYVNGNWGVRAGSRWPHTKDQSEGRYMPFPFFLAQAAALLQKNKVDVQIIDAIAQQMTEEDFMDQLLDKNIDYLVAETSIPSLLQDMEILKKITNLGKKIILCGPNSLTYQPSFMNQYPFIDFVLKGEYEFTLLELVKALENKTDFLQVSGMLYNNGKEFLSTAERKLCDVDALPWPLRESLPMDKYWDLPGDIPYPSVQMLASRGCPFNCSFCLWPQVMYQGSSYRPRDVEDVVNEMEYLVKKMGFQSVYFDDDTFNIGKERMLKFCHLVQERGLSHTPWAIMARADVMDEEILLMMKKSGLAAVKYGVESFDQGLVASCQKGLDLSKAERMIKFTKKLGIKVHLTFTFGFSGETKKTLKKTIDRGINLNPDSVQFSILTPFPGTRLFSQLESSGRIMTYDWNKYDGNNYCVFKSEGIKPQELLEARKYAYFLWGNHQKKRTGWHGNFKKFKILQRTHGWGFAVKKSFAYLRLLLIEKITYSNAKY